MRQYFKSMSICVCAMISWVGPTPAEESGVMTYVYNAPESELDQRYTYHWEILRTALDKTIEKYGPYVMKASERMSEQRQSFELKEASGKLGVMYLSTTPDLEQHLIPIRIPVDKNLGGYCIFMIRKGDEARFASVTSVDDLKPFRFGLGLGWIDVGILQHNGLQVVTGSNYDGLFEMLVNNRFDIFLRAAVEILGEYDARKDQLPDLAIEDSLILYYPLPMYFWFSRNDEGKRLAARAEEGMRMMIDDGTYDAVFDAYQRRKIEQLDLKHRRLLKIENPYLGPETPFEDKRLWFDPNTYE